jgi:type IV pilus assembly protein PilO
VILINLLPHREVARKQRRDIFNISLGASIFLGGILAGVIFLWYQAAISLQQGTNQTLRTEIKKLEEQIKDISALEAEIAALQARQKAVEDLQSDRNLPVHLLTELVNQLPDGVYITKMTQADQLVSIAGVAQSNERVAELLRNLSNNTPWFSKPELVEIVAGSVALSNKEQRRVSNFNMRVRLVRATDTSAARWQELAGTRMATKTSPSFDFEALKERVVSQFRDLDPKDPSMWPAVPRNALFAVATIVVVVALWFLWLNSSQEILEQEQQSELSLKTEYKAKLVKAVNLDVLKKQREQVEQYVTQLEKQLPSKAEMDALLSDITQAGVGRSLQFDLFRPGQIAVKEYYAELPIAIKVTGRYHDIGSFASDIANLSRIVTLNNLSIAPKSDGSLVLESTAKTFRYLDNDEVAAQRKAAVAKGAKK